MGGIAARTKKGASGVGSNFKLIGAALSAATHGARAMQQAEDIQKAHLEKKQQGEGGGATTTAAAAAAAVHSNGEESKKSETAGTSTKETTASATTNKDTKTTSENHEKKDNNDEDEDFHIDPEAEQKLSETFDASLPAFLNVSFLSLHL